MPGYGSSYGPTSRGYRGPATVIAAVAPVVSSVSPTLGDIAGGYSATITGTGLTASTGATFGAAAATSYVVVNDTTATCTVPAGASGLASIAITGSPGGASTGGTNAFEYFSPAQLNLTGWFRGFSGGVMTPVASAGTSGSRVLSVGTGTVTAGTAVNGSTPARFGGAAYLVSNANDTVHWSAAAGSTLVLANVSSAGADNVNTNSVPGFVSANGEGAFSIGFSTAGLRVNEYDGAYKELSTTCTTAAWHCLSATFDSANLKSRIDGNAQASIAAGACANFSGTIPLVVGRSVGGVLITGDMLEVITAQTALSLATLDKIRGYMNTRYGLSI